MTQGRRLFPAPAVDRAPVARGAWARSRALATAGQERLVVSRHRIAESRHHLQRSHGTIGRCIAGGVDESGGAVCGHPDAIQLKIRGTYEEACRERDRLKEQFPEAHVSPVLPLSVFEWTWSLCGECKA
jgi:hypothetical protein